MASINSTKEETNFIDDEIEFLKHSRESWKAKNQETKLSMKRIKNRIRYLEKSKKSWKDLAKKLKSGIDEDAS